jgi:HAMP domain-containing protein
MPGIDYTLGMKTGGFSSGVNGALGKLADLGKKTAALTVAAGLAAGVGLGAAVAKGIASASRIENLETAFAPLLGGFEEAKERIAELSRFAAATPFDLPGIAQASKTLEKPTKGLLATGDGLRLVGDAASFAQVPIEEMAVTVGRLYDSLASGRAAGETLQRLQELAVISGEARGEIERLNGTVGNSAEAWAIARRELEGFSGSMALQSLTWTGLMSTFGDTIDMTFAKFGKPIMDSLKPYLANVTATVENLGDFAERMGKRIAGALDIGLSAFESGKIPELIGDGLTLAVIDGVNAFSQGIRGTMAFLSTAFSSIMADVRESWGLSEMLGILRNLGEGIGSAITTAILKGLDAVPGLDLGADITRSEANTNNKFNQAKNRLEDFQGGDAVRELFDSMGDALKEGRAAFTAAAADPLLDRAPAAARFGELQAELAQRTAARRAETEAKLADMEAKIKARRAGAATTNSASPSERAAQSGNTRPAVDRLAQIGGFVGSAATGLAQRAAEKTASYMEKAVVRLTSIDKRLSNPTPAGVFL